MSIDPSSTPSDSPGEPPEYTPSIPDPEPKIIPLAPDLATDNQVQALIASAQAASVPLGGFAANDQIEALLGQISESGVVQAQAPQQAFTPVGGIDATTLEALKGYDVAQIRGILDSQPEFRGMTVEKLGLAGNHPTPSIPAGGGWAPPHHQYPNREQPPHLQGYGQPVSLLHFFDYRSGHRRFLSLAV